MITGVSSYFPPPVLISTRDARVLESLSVACPHTEVHVSLHIGVPVLVNEAVAQGHGTRSPWTE